VKLLSKIIATSFGVGYAPVAPGTAGAVLASAVAYLVQPHLSYTHFQYLLGVLIVMGTILGIIATNNLEDEWGKDPSKIVMDESVGQWITYLFIPFGLTNILLGLLLFRIFDIWKPLIIGRAEKLPGGIGVMADDILAGIFANVVLQILIILVF
jgi:phosphatidylglycerophosphatase A